MKLSIIFFLLNILISSCTVSQEKGVIPIDATRNVTLLTVKIGNVEIPNILLDTGMPLDGIMIYNPDYKDSLDLTNAVEVKIGGAGDGDDSKALLIDSTEFFLGDIKMKNQRIIMLLGDLYKGFPSNGIIGYSIFGHYITEFDYDNNIMTLHTSDEINVDSSWTEIPLYFKDHDIPWIDASVVIKDEDPISLSMYIDYAARDALVLLEKPGMKFSLPEETEKMYLGRGLSGDIYGRTGIISKLIIGPYELNNVKAAFAPAEVRSKQDNADGILGNSSLKKFNLIFDYADEKLYLRPNTFFKKPF